MSHKINFNSTLSRSKIKMIIEKWARPMTAQEAALEMGMQRRSLYLWIVHLRESGALEEVSRRSRKGGGSEISYMRTGRYNAIPDDWDDGVARRVSGVKPFRDSLCEAFYGPARASP